MRPAQLVWLFGQLIGRDLGQRYKQTSLGFLWPIIAALVQIGIYVVVFALIFRVRWPQATAGAPSHSPALTLFAGLIPIMFASEVITRAPTVIVSVPNLVKKLPFPLAILPVVCVASAMVQSLINVALFVVFSFILEHDAPWTLIYLPLIYLPLTIFCLAIGWAISALGVFVRDVAQIVPLLVQALMFTAPVFYPLEAVPPPLLRLVELNPLTSAVEGFRDTLSLGVQPNWSNFGLTTVAYFILAAACLWFFRRVQHAFADAI